MTYNKAKQIEMTYLDLGSNAWHLAMLNNNSELSKAEAYLGIHSL